MTLKETELHETSIHFLSAHPPLRATGWWSASGVFSHWTIHHFITLAMKGTLAGTSCQSAWRACLWNQGGSRSIWRGATSTGVDQYLVFSVQSGCFRDSVIIRSEMAAQCSDFSEQLKFKLCHLALPWRSLAAATTSSPRGAFYQLTVSHAGTENPIHLTSSALELSPSGGRDFVHRMWPGLLQKRVSACLSDPTEQEMVRLLNNFLLPLLFIYSCASLHVLGMHIFTST